MRRFLIVILFFFFSVLSLHSTIYTYTVPASGDYSGATISAGLTAACTGSCTGAGTDTVKVLLTDGIKVTLNGDWDLTSFTCVIVELQGEESQIDFDNNNETIDMSQISFVIVDPGNDGGAGDSDGEEAIISANSGNNIFNIGDEDYKGNVFNNIISNGGVSYTGFGSPLPIELAFFKGSSLKDAVTLEWQTASELNNDFYEVLHSQDGATFTVIESILGAGTTIETQDYTVQLYDLAAGSHYFKLKQTDFNGDSEEFEMIAVEIENNINFSIYPVPARDHVSIILNNNSDQIEIEIIDKLQHRLIHKLSSGSNSLEINTSELDHGTYLLHVTTQSQEIWHQLLIE